MRILFLVPYPPGRAPSQRFRFEQYLDILTARGHELKVRGDFTQSVGGGQAVSRDFSTGINFGASDPRKDGAAVPEPVSSR